VGELGRDVGVLVGDDGICVGFGTGTLVGLVGLNVKGLFVGFLVGGEDGPEEGTTVGDEDEGREEGDEDGK